MANGWGGVRPGSGRKPGGAPALRRLRKAEAVDILGRCDEYALWARLLCSKDERVVLQALMFLVTQRDGRAYQQVNPLQAQRLAAGDDPKLAAVLQNLLPQPGATVTITEKKLEIGPSQALENRAIEAERESLSAALPVPAGMPLTLDASTASMSDPSGRKAGVGHFGAESHTERNQNSGLPKPKRVRKAKAQCAAEQG